MCLKNFLQDPAAEAEACPVRRIVGSIGKLGLCILQPPVVPEMKKFSIDASWRLANYQDFDCKYEDNFASSSLHISFTGSRVP